MIKFKGRTCVAVREVISYAMGLVLTDPKDSRSVGPVHVVGLPAAGLLCRTLPRRDCGVVKV